MKLKLTPFEELIEGLALTFIFIVFGLTFLVAAAIILFNNPFSVIVGGIAAYVLWAANKEKLF